MSPSQLLLKFAPPPRALGEGEKWNVFLSYRSVDRKWVINLYDTLRSVGHEVFLDQCVLRGGDQLIRVLEDGLEASQAGVLVWSRESADSEWVRREYHAMEDMAQSTKGFAFVPVRLDEHELPRFAKSRVFIDFASYPDGPNGGELIRLLHAVVGQPMSPEAVRFAQELDDAANQANNRIRAAVLASSPDTLCELIEEGGLVWEASATLGCAAANGLIDLGHPERAATFLRRISETFPAAIRPKQLLALALARTGAEEGLNEAQMILGTLYADGERDPETLGIYARTFMDRVEAGGEGAGDPMLRKSRDLYVEAFEGAADDYYTGINAATKNVLVGDSESLAAAQEIAARVEEIVGSEIVPDDYWMSATVAEVQLIKGDFEGAAALYAAAVAVEPGSVGSHRSTCNQAVRLMDKMNPSDAERREVLEAFAHLDEDA